MQDALGIDTPKSGVLYDDMAFDSGGAAVLDDPVMWLVWLARARGTRLHRA